MGKKDYKKYKKIDLGYSNVASLLMRGCGADGQVSKFLDFGRDGFYDAYLVDENAVFDSRFELVETFQYWLKIYDDDSMVFDISAPLIRVYQGCDWEREVIIQTVGKLEVEMAEYED